MRTHRRRKSTKSQPLPAIRSIGYLDLVVEQGEMYLHEAWGFGFSVLYDNETETAFTSADDSYIDNMMAIERLHAEDL